MKKVGNIIDQSKIFINFPTMLRHSLIIASLAAFAIGFAPLQAYPADKATQKYPDVIAAKVRTAGTDTFNFDVTVSSPYDTPRRYADAFRALGSDGTVFGERINWGQTTIFAVNN